MTAHKPSNLLGVNEDGEPIEPVRSPVRFPSIFSRSWEESDDISKIKDFFVKERGSIAETDAIRITHKVDVSDTSRKVFVEPYIESNRA